MNKITGILLMSFLIQYHAYAGITFRRNAVIQVTIHPGEAEVVHTALDIVSNDYKTVFGGDFSKSDDGQIFIGTLGNGSIAETSVNENSLRELQLHEEGFILEVKNDKLYIVGSDKRGTAYGILELTRLFGISPWEWWADSFAEKKEVINLPDDFIRLEYPSVARRGIFINDEDWGLTPWSYLTHEPSDRKGEIGPRTHARIFELLLRLRANTFWPAMHECSVAFYMTPGNKEMADKYGIFVGSSHCEPMARNTNAEWKIAGTGTYDYVNNRENVLKFWEERVKELAASDNIYTLGIRGVHDSKMLGANTLQEQLHALQNVLKDQREMIARYINPDVEKVSQVFIPYKEVLDVYHMGLEVPEDVTLMWCDDNYGYLRHFPDSMEQARKGGNGIYYHVSYWGRPHDYLWLSTNHPAQVYTQMKLAYEKGAGEMWILNVGDIKPGEYLIELFMDMAWNINDIENSRAGLDNHLYSWLKREFGEEYAGTLLEVMNEYYRLAYIRKPEFMGNTRVEEKDPAYKIVSDLPWSQEDIYQRIREYEQIDKKIKYIAEKISPEKQDAWFQLVEYPVRAAAEMNKKHLYGQLARHGKEEWGKSDAAYQAIVELTEKYNSLADGKWNKMMDYRPRRLSIFDPVPHTEAVTPLVGQEIPLYLFNGTEYDAFKGKEPLSHGLGYARKAISLPKNGSVDYYFETTDTDTIQVQVSLAPNHPVEGNTLRYAISIDEEPVQIIEYQTKGRSEEWKQNVLRNQAIRKTKHFLQEPGKHTLKIIALDEGVILDQIKIF